MDSVHRSKPWYKKSHVWILVFIGILILVGIAGNDPSKTKSSTKTEVATTEASTETPAETAKPGWDAEAIYNQIQAGMTKAQAEQIIGKTSDDCSKSSLQGYGESEYCYYRGGFGDKGSIGVSYHDGIVETKSKSGF